MIDVTIGGPMYTEVSIATDEDIDHDYAKEVAEYVIEKNIGKSITEGPQPDWVKSQPMFEKADWTVEQFETHIENEIISQCKQR